MRLRVLIYGNVLAAARRRTCGQKTTAAAACTDVLLPRATTRLVPSAAPHVHGHHRHRGSGAVAAAANTTDLLSIAAAAYTFSFFFLFFLYSFHIIRSSPHSSRQQSSFYSRCAHLYTHVLYLLQILSFLNIYRHYIAITIIYFFFLFFLIIISNTTGILLLDTGIVVTLAPERGYGPAGQRVPGLTVF